MAKRTMRLDLRRFTYICGFTGTAVMLMATLTAALAFRGPRGYPYSILNRNISDLGKPTVSELAAVFNWGLSMGGLFLTLFMVGLTLFARSRRMYLVGLAGVVAAIGVIFVGVYPVTQFYYHTIAAFTFFLSGSVTFTFFTLTVLFNHPERLSRWLAIPGLIAMLAFALFLGLPQYLYENPHRAFVLGPPGPNRPIFWLPSLLEWVVFLVVASWVLLISGYLYRQEQIEGASAGTVAGQES
jgi:hypothetical membrane protein